MPKKFSGANSKAVAARQRKETQEAARKTKEPSSSEEESDNTDGKLLRKQQRKEQQELKKQQRLERKAEAQATLAAELSSIQPNKTAAPQKVTRNQIEKSKTSSKSTTNTPANLSTALEKNLNRLSEGECARNIDQAIAILSGPKSDKHAEKRMKALHLAYEERRLRELKAENSTLRLSQMKAIIFKEWKSHPDNPMNKTL